MKERIDALLRKITDDYRRYRKDYITYYPDHAYLQSESILGVDPDPKNISHWIVVMKGTRFPEARAYVSLDKVLTEEEVKSIFE